MKKLNRISRKYKLVCKAILLRSGRGRPLVNATYTGMAPGGSTIENNENRVAKKKSMMLELGQVNLGPGTFLNAD